VHFRQGAWGVQALNDRIAVALGLSANRDKSFQPQASKDHWFVGRPIMVTRNDYHLNLMNGDVGQCLPTASGLRVAFPDGQGGVRWVLPSRLDAVETVWAMTVHKSQGSEYDHVLMVLPDQRCARFNARVVVYRRDSCQNQAHLVGSESRGLVQRCAPTGHPKWRFGRWLVSSGKIRPFTNPVSSR
jgi:ATP-dependent exoDNAse (exonuclease V) alpha subunit